MFARFAKILHLLSSFLLAVVDGPLQLAGVTLVDHEALSAL